MAETLSYVPGGANSSLQDRMNGGLRRFEGFPKTIYGAVFCAALLRLIVVIARFKYLAAPTLEHGDFGGEMGWVARSLALHLGFSSPFFPRSGPTALLPPVFPFILSIIFRITGLYTSSSALLVLLFQSICSAVTCFPVYRIGKRLYSQRAGTLAAWTWALYPFSIYYSAGEIWDYALTALLFIVILAVLLSLSARSSTGTWLGTGLLMGLGGLANPSILPAAVALAVFRLFAGARQRTRSLLKAAALLAATLLVLLPWSIRNERLLKAWVPVRDGFWLEAWAGNHGDTFVTNPASAHPASNPTEMALFLDQGELPYLARKKSLTTAWVIDHPDLFAKISARRVLRFWTGFWSLEPAYLKEEPFDIPACLLCTCITTMMLLGLRTLRRQGSSGFWNVVVVLVLFPCPYYVTHASMDYRQPIEPLVVVLMSIGFLGQRKAPHGLAFSSTQMELEQEAR